MKLSTFLIGVILILAGISMFLVNAGYTSWAAWGQISKLWPLFLIFFGIKMVWRDKIPPWLNYAVILVAAAGVIALLLFAPKSDYPVYDHQRNRASLIVTSADYPNLSSGELQAEFGGGKLTVGPSTDQWIEGSFQGAEATTRVSGDHGKLKLKLGQSRKFSRRRLRGDSLNWNINLSPKLFWDFSLDAGAFKGKMDLTGIRFRLFKLDLGASNVDITLGDNGDQGEIKIDAGASRIQVNVPENTGVKVKLDSALSGNNLNQLGWTQENHYYTSPNYEKVTSHVIIDLDMAVGNFTIVPVSNSGSSW